MFQVERTRAGDLYWRHEDYLLGRRVLDAGGPARRLGDAYWRQEHLSGGLETRFGGTTTCSAARRRVLAAGGPAWRPGDICQAT